MKRNGKLAIVAVVVGLVGALLATAAASGSVAGAKIDLQANDVDGDRFVLIQDEGITHTQTLTKQGACGFASSGDSDELVTLDAVANPNNPAPGLKDHIFGVNAQGEGNGTPCARIDGSSSGRGEQLIIEFAGPTIGNWYADYAQFGVKLKFGASGTIQALLNGEDVVGLSQTIDCTGGDCGPDSGNDRVLFTLDGGGQLFNGVMISVDSPADGSMSLLDDPGANLDSYFLLAEDTEAPVITLDGPDPLDLIVGDSYVDPGATVTDNFDGVTTPITGSPSTIDTSVSGSHTVTYNATDSSGNAASPVSRTVNVYDGILNCGFETFSVGASGTMEGIFKRLANVDGSDCFLKPYDLNVSSDGSTIAFDPEGDQNAAYSGFVAAPEKSSLLQNPTNSQLTYDPELDLTFVPMQWCTDATFSTDGYVSSATLPGTESWCIAAENTVTVGGGNIRTTWTVYGHDDPFFRGN